MNKERTNKDGLEYKIKVDRTITRKCVWTRFLLVNTNRLLVSAATTKSLVRIDRLYRAGEYLGNRIRLVFKKSAQ